MTLTEKLATIPGLTQDLEHWASYEVYTAEDLERYLLETTIWDMYKEVHGIRPRFMDMSSMSIKELEAEIDSLDKQLTEVIAREKAAQAESITAFEKHVVNTICMGAGNRETALRWIMDGSEAGGDWEYFSYLHGLPYSYFKTMQVAA